MLAEIQRIKRDFVVVKIDAFFETVKRNAMK
jgi:hypothetical protein